ncbi:MAG: alanine dehydrogenase [Gammaproteobacteria bacterium RIFCSPLOWO2_02_FULL_42_14]|nr:MAG: alanine dehydrogenase [Gammaproteobacteria bacterium RIFCSPHIGHO2_02_FULL_42_43]OGT28615.1 MAG: alanine dehydrogenase [Gammaproteobacteria bacterium RIFCSPHIGHO2_01_FULL_42_8]OGT53022.1 MAG: alanine dehydrogenase [Gammaproteobacteria bacterium RIFCSPHIGHO2_12_FULL_41_25]OGT61206.1 MAG: alanine dehydrogenase [Gammaproteobacteria bacterium RIFCSPLOWO2_02_FULL_42_14]OGT87133.1 MAG: alanine dehydrogenase [Gammaproteobacteria bacterium RIFCSPLOWO2_12_FULL_42_18]
MKIGVPKEIKTEEYRVGMTPFSVHEAVSHGHHVMVEHGAGLGIGFGDESYREAGAAIGKSAKEVWEFAEMIVKVKEPQSSEFSFLRENLVLFTYLHLAPDAKQADALLKSGCVAIAYETVTDAKGGLPLLSPMSQVAGRLSVQVGSTALEKSHGGSGVLLGGVPGVYPGKITVIGGGVVGTNAVRMAMGREATVTVLDTSLHRLQELDLQFGGRLNTVYSTIASLAEHVTSADLVIGAVLIPGRAAPKLIPRSLLSQMKPGSVIVDVAIDQGGCLETSRATTHAAPTFVVDGVVHYCVANMPGAVPRTATLALNNATLPYVMRLANLGFQKALRDDAFFRSGLNVCRGAVTNEDVAGALSKDYVPAMDIL